MVTKRKKHAVTEIGQLGGLHRTGFDYESCSVRGNTCGEFDTRFDMRVLEADLTWKTRQLFSLNQAQSRSPLPPPPLASARGQDSTNFLRRLLENRKRSGHRIQGF